jgi:predicted metal-binding membrane protein
MKLPWNNSNNTSLAILGISAFVWVLLLVNPGHIMSMEHCHVSDAGPSQASLQMMLQMNPLSTQFLGWGLMVIAMMLPKLIMPVRHIYACSFSGRRLPLSLVFVAGYIAVWMIVGIAMIAIIIGAHLLMSGSYLPIIAVGIVAIVWQFSPVKQRCLNRGHDHRIIAAFGWQSYRDALRFGLSHGAWCVGAGWALMLFPMLLPAGHNAAMILLTFVMLSEHMEHPQVPAWRINFRTRLLRILIGQAQIKWEQIQKAEVLVK